MGVFEVLTRSYPAIGSPAHRWLEQEDGPRAENIL
jgi:hypothetical protein